MQSDGLVLRDIHQPPAPPWWPPAPGWWVAGLLLLALLAIAAAWWWRRHRRRQALLALFDAAGDDASPAPARLATVSELLRRAARRVDPAADRLAGEEWLRFLDGQDGGRPFSRGPGRILLDGGYRRDVDPAAVAALLPHARARYLGLLGGKR